MKWLGLDYDEEVFYQTKNAKRHLEVVEQLIASGHAYKCEKTSRDGKTGTVSVNDGCYTSQSYRKQTSVKIAGLFWGCDCSIIAITLPACFEITPCGQYPIKYILQIYP